MVVNGNSDHVSFANIEGALTIPDTQIRIFGKPEVKGHRRMAVLLARGASVEEAREKVNKAYDALKVEV